MEPDRALAVLVEIIKEMLPLVDEQARIDFVVSMLGQAGSDKVASLVDL
jgi:UTP-glucose-1-phosphate uridylyltransferase